MDLSCSSFIAQEGKWYLFIHIYLWNKVWTQFMKTMVSMSLPAWSTVLLYPIASQFHFTLLLYTWPEIAICHGHWYSNMQKPLKCIRDHSNSVTIKAILQLILVVFASCSQSSRIFFHIFHNISHCSLQLVDAHSAGIGPWEDWSLTHLFMRVSAGWYVPSAALSRPKSFPHRGLTPNSGTIYFLFLSTLSIILCSWIIYGVQKGSPGLESQPALGRDRHGAVKTPTFCKVISFLFFPGGRQPTFPPLNVLFVNLEFQSVDGDSDAMDNCLIWKWVIKAENRLKSFE